LATDETKPALRTFVIWAPDYTDEDAFNRRMAVRDNHMVKAMENVKAGFFTRKRTTHENWRYWTNIVPGIIGPCLTPESIATPDAPKKLIGSMLIVRG
jgi:uncharacterized protein